MTTEREYTFAEKFNFLYNFYKEYSPVILKQKSQSEELQKLKSENLMLNNRIKFHLSKKIDKLELENKELEHKILELESSKFSKIKVETPEKPKIKIERKRKRSDSGSGPVKSESGRKKRRSGSSDKKTANDSGYYNYFSDQSNSGSYEMPGETKRNALLPSPPNSPTPPPPVIKIISKNPPKPDQIPLPFYKNILITFPNIQKYYLQILTPSDFSFFDFGHIDDYKHNRSMDITCLKNAKKAGRDTVNLHYRRPSTTVNWQTNFSGSDKSRTNNSLILSANDVDQLINGVQEFIDYIKYNHFWWNKSDISRRACLPSLASGKVPIKLILNDSQFNFENKLQNKVEFQQLLESAEEKFEVKNFDAEKLVRTTSTEMVEGKGRNLEKVSEMEFSLLEVNGKSEGLRIFMKKLISSDLYKRTSSKLIKPLDVSKLDMKELKRKHRVSCF